MKTKMTRAAKMVALSLILCITGIASMLSMVILDLMPVGGPVSTSEGWALGVFLIGMIATVTGSLLLPKFVVPWVAEGVHPASPDDPGTR